MTGLAINSNFNINGLGGISLITLPNFKNKRPLSFLGGNDSFKSGVELSQYNNPVEINKMIVSNPNISKILGGYGLPVSINLKELQKIFNSHLPQTQKIVSGIYSNLSEAYKSTIDLNSVQKAAFLHDLGKILIPGKILDKPDKLTTEEFKIIKLHPILSYELLKTSNIGSKTLDLIKYHHQNPSRTGYPNIDEVYVWDLNSQLLSIADTFSALLEKRPYKNEFTKSQALSIIHKKMKAGEIHPYLFKALVDYVNSTSKHNNREVFYKKPAYAFGF